MSVSDLLDIGDMRPLVDGVPNRRPSSDRYGQRAEGDDLGEDQGPEPRGGAAEESTAAAAEGTASLRRLASRRIGHAGMVIAFS